MLGLLNNLAATYITLCILLHDKNIFLVDCVYVDTIFKCSVTGHCTYTCLYRIITSLHLGMLVFKVLISLANVMHIMVVKLL